ncbi:5-hydroxytryptamine receptor 2C-like [Tachypleus tridentatus]|uniref:5-hydroxytryptamine receptor 2C-like n=1 Tax=Tachypleus tridentatus TaxID=6853 RepID=UPI003FD0B6BD
MTGYGQLHVIFYLDSNNTLELTTTNISEDISLTVEMNLTKIHVNKTMEDIVESMTVMNNTSSNLIDGYNWLSLLLLMFVISGVLGNVLVCLAICRERRLQNVTNYFLLSLAVADLLVCMVVMPFGIVDQLFGYWPIGSSACNVWVTCDVLGCTSSIIHMCFISLGRYLGIRNPLKTRGTSKKVVTIKIAIVWLVSMVITSPITVLGNINTENIHSTNYICAINNRFFFVFGSLSAFYIPMFVMVTSYVLTVRLLQQKAKYCAEKSNRRVPFTKRHRRQSLQQSSTDPFGTTTKKENSKCNKCGACQHQDTHEEETFLDPRHGNSRVSYVDFHGSLKRQNNIKFKVIGGVICALGSSSQVMNEQKATKVLGIVFFCFAICWTPFFTLNILLPFTDPTTFPDYLTTTFLWLGYVSSTINPIIYTIFNKKFRRAFWILLSCTCCLNNIKSPTINEMATWPTKSKPFVVKSDYPPANPIEPIY